MTGQIDDLAINNNGDSEKVLATVVDAGYAFFDNHPHAWVYASGSNSARTRLYRTGIAKYYEEVKEDFDIYGQVGEHWEVFEKQGIRCVSCTAKNYLNLNYEKHTSAE